METSISSGSTAKGGMNHDQLMQEVDHYLHVSMKSQGPFSDSDYRHYAQKVTNHFVIWS